ncbi:hypothetical protein ACP8HI_19885 [Paenibacillus sp. FA6]|uniref:hypothetical protein n=1 Tax=Paenibacillus sp. FA6 TaxID=3413029 RepID=UPI003F65C552
MSFMNQLYRLILMFGLALVMALSFPVSSHEEYTSETSHNTISSEFRMANPLIRKPALPLSKTMFVAQLLPLLFSVFILEFLHVPSCPNPFKRCIMLLLRRLFLNPIKYTSTFLSRETSLVL